MNNCHNICLPSCRVWNKLSRKVFHVFSVLILFQLHQFPFIMTQIQCIGDPLIVKTWLKLHKYEELPQYFPLIL